MLYQGLVKVLIEAHTLLPGEIVGSREGLVAGWRRGQRRRYSQAQHPPFRQLGPFSHTLFEGY